MKVCEVVIGQNYWCREWLRPIRPAWYARWDPGRGFPGCWIWRQVLIVERVGQHFIGERMEWKCLSRDMDTLKCTWEKRMVREHVYARNLLHGS